MKTGAARSSAHSFLDQRPRSNNATEWTLDSHYYKRGFFKDGRFPTLLDVVNHYDPCFSLGLSRGENSDLVQYLKSLPREQAQTR